MRAIGVLVATPVVFVSIFAAIAWAQESARTAFVMSVATQNMSIPGLDIEELKGLTGGKLPAELAMFGPQRMLQLDLRSPGVAPKDAFARLGIPDGLQLGKELELEILRPMKATTASSADGSAEKLPDFTIKTYWECSEDVKPGQPRILDSKTIQASLKDAMRRGQEVMRKTQRRPGTASLTDANTHAFWPNTKNAGRPVVIVKEASLVGGHTLRSNYAGTSEFAIDKALDFMEPVTFTSPKEDNPDLRKAIKLAWKRVPNATGYGLMATSSPDNGKTIIIWWSSSVYSDEGIPLDFAPPEQVQKLIQQGIVLSPDHTTCTIPRGIFKECNAVVVQLIAYGGVKVFADRTPPVRIQVKSTGMLMLGMPGG